MSRSLLEEKLDEIYENLSTVIDIGGEFKGIIVPKEYFDWFVEQAERAQELEELNRILSSDKSMFIE